MGGLTTQDADAREPVVRLRDMRFAYPGSSALFAGLSLDIAAGVTLLDGESGSGKTTLLRLLGGELDGEGEFCLRGSGRRTDPAAWRREVCWFDPRDEAFDTSTAADLMAAQRDLHPMLDAAACQRHLEAFDLAPHLAKPFYALSTGSRRKVGLAVALSVGCALTLLDEAASGLDMRSLRYLEQVLAEAAKHPSRALLIVSPLALQSVPFSATITLP